MRMLVSSAAPWWVMNPPGPPGSPVGHAVRRRTACRASQPRMPVMNARVDGP